MKLILLALNRPSRSREASSERLASAAAIAGIDRIQNRPSFLGYFAQKGGLHRNSQRKHGLFPENVRLRGDWATIASDFNGYFARLMGKWGNKPYFMAYFC
ncbi:MAG: hypothetical protein J7639_07625 [Paenibacillaceae bacterium]|nr:hypothetical protein [Paenibacillaceae bacterium]